MSKIFFLTLVVTLLSACGSGQQAATGESATAEVVETTNSEALAVLVPGSGTYSRPISTDSEEAQAFFDQGLRLAWGFYFLESIASYQEAARLDPNHPMPYWGMAHAMGPNPNSRYARMPDDPQGEGLKAITMAKELSSNGTAMEQDLINAMFVLYDKVSIPDDAERDQAYLDAARALHQKYPEDSDIAALYAAAYMSIGRWDYWDADGQPKSETAEVAAAMEAVMEASGPHPGVDHLFIHLLEASLEPERALPSADRLEASMPIAGHMVHMPAHIYVRVGQYEKAIASNVRSQEADVKFAEIWGDYPLPNLGTYPLNHKMHAPHAIDFIRYAATVQGNYETALEAALRSAASVVPERVDMRGGQKRVSGPWMVYKIFGKWDEILSHERKFSGRPYLDGMWSYVIGSAYAATDQLDKAREESAKLTTLANAPNADEYRVGATPASAVLQLAAHALEGEIHQAAGNFDAAVESFAAAVAIEDQNNYTEPPDWSQPARHYLGAALIAGGRAEEAEAVYRRDLRWNQNNGWSLFGLTQALEMQGKDEAAAEVRAQFEAAWQHADVALIRSRM